MDMEYKNDKYHQKPQPPIDVKQRVLMVLAILIVFFILAGLVIKILFF